MQKVFVFLRFLYFSINSRAEITNTIILLNAYMEKVVLVVKYSREVLVKPQLLSPIKYLFQHTYL